MIPCGIFNVGKDEFSAAEHRGSTAKPSSKGGWKIHQVRKWAPKCSQKRDGSLQQLTE